MIDLFGRGCGAGIQLTIKRFSTCRVSVRLDRMPVTQSRTVHLMSVIPMRSTTRPMHFVGGREIWPELVA